jgi:site-specific recombinase XerD
MEEAGIEANGRNLTWHSIRHSTGMYVYNQHKDLELVAEILRQKSLQAAKRYAHPTPETKRDVIESIQGGGY